MIISLLLVVVLYY